MPKTLMPNPRLSYCLSSTLHLIKYFYSPTSDFCIVCELQVEWGILDAFWSIGWKCIKLVVTSRRPNVVTSPRRDVPTS